MAAIAVIGAGAWGTALARLLGQHGEPVVLWTWQPEHALCMQRDRVNSQFFAGFPLGDSVRVTSDIGDALREADLVLFVVPSDVFRTVLIQARPHVPEHAALVSATKGIENGSLMLMSEIIHEVLGEAALMRSAALSGPSFAPELARGLLTNVVVAGPSHDLCARIQVRLSAEPLRVYTSDDQIGVQMGGALKNVIAIAAGASDGLGFGHNTRAALITRGLAEITRLAVAKGGHPLTLSGLAGMGDLVLTCTGELSRNRTVGFDLGRGEKLEDVLAKLGHVAEGVPTAQSAYSLARQLGVDLPICSEVYKVLFERKAPPDAVRELTARPLRKERD